MSILKAKDIRNMKSQEMEKKLKELKLELIKSKVNTGQGNSKSRQIKRAIARILTLK